MNSHSHFQDESKNEERRGRRTGGQEGRKPLLLSPFHFVFVFLSRSNFRVIVRLERLVAPANVQLVM